MPACMAWHGIWVGHTGHGEYSYSTLFMIDNMHGLLWPFAGYLHGQMYLDCNSWTVAKLL